MTAAATYSPALDQPKPSSLIALFLRALRNGVITAVVLIAFAFFLRLVLRPAIASVNVEEMVTQVLYDVLMTLMPYLSLISAASAVRGAFRRGSAAEALIAAAIAVALVYGGVTAVQSVLKIGPFSPTNSLQMTLEPHADGALVTDVVPGGAAETGGIQVGDVITGIRRDPITFDTLTQQIAQALPDDPFRLRVNRNGEEDQFTVRVVLAPDLDNSLLVTGFLVALVIGLVAVVFPGGLVPYALMVMTLIPLIVGYTWLIIATFSERTRGVLPIDANGEVGGLTLANWSFLTNPRLNVLAVTINSLMVALFLVVLVLIVSSMAGYALSRMNFSGRRTFLSLTLILHGFPAVTLLISIFFVLNFISKIPVIGQIFGYNTLGGIALVMVAFELPLGIWLMKGFFDNISWDMERSALIDGASRWRTFWEIILPQIRPGILALGIFAFISGWNSYLIPQTFSTGSNTATLSVFLQQFTADTAPVNWNVVAAAGLFQLIPIFVFFVFAQEYLLNIYAGGLKGSN